MHSPIEHNFQVFSSGYSSVFTFSSKLSAMVPSLSGTSTGEGAGFKVKGGVLNCHHQGMHRYKCINNRHYCCSYHHQGIHRYN